MVRWRIFIYSMMHSYSHYAILVCAWVVFVCIDVHSPFVSQSLGFPVSMSFAVVLVSISLSISVSVCIYKLCKCIRYEQDYPVKRVIIAQFQLKDVWFLHFCSQQQLMARIRELNDFF